MEAIQTKIIRVTECEAKETAKGNYFLRMKFELANQKKGSLSLFLDAYEPKEVTDLLNVLNFKGEQSDFMLKESEQRVKNFHIDFGNAVICTVTKEEFVTNDNKTIEWYKVRKIGNDFELKEKANNTIKNKEQFLRSFPSPTSAVPF